MSFSIVVSKYKENVEWLSDYIDKYPIFLYDKGGEYLNYNKSINVNYLDNIGRESHTYLNHIIENYESLTDYVIFTQGNYKDHIKSFDKLIKKKNCYFHLMYYPKNFRLQYYKGNLKSNTENFTFGQWFDKYINDDNSCDKFHFYMKYGAIFTIKKENILSRPKEFYIGLIKQLEESGNNPEIGHFFERSWFYIFNCHKTPKDMVKGYLFKNLLFQKF